VLLALGRFISKGSTEVDWATGRAEIASLLAEFAPASSTDTRQGAAYPFTRLRNDGIWTLDQDVPMDNVGPLTRQHVTGKIESGIERQLRPDLVYRAARCLVESEFPPTVAPDVLEAVGLDPDAVLAAPRVVVDIARRRSASWKDEILRAWDRQCAFCGFDGKLGLGSVGVEAAHVRWFNFQGPDAPDNGLTLCALHHKLFDRGALGIDLDLRIIVSTLYSSNTEAGRAVYALLGRRLVARPGTPMPARIHLLWHRDQVFQGPELRAG
jgi:putative restriction endonuclease